ncbi:MAG: hypothetical protein OXI33_13175 [Chloroflexota bacterium]|nr:hypothetical protein [Chloroflexota bacterium]
MMRRAHIRLDEATYALARQRASAEGISFAAFVRRAVEQQLAPEGRTLHDRRQLASRSMKLPRVEDFTFIGSGRSDQGDLSPVSERHDEVLEEAFSDH